jgi:hypothetical protein
VRTDFDAIAQRFATAVDAVDQRIRAAQERLRASRVGVEAAVLFDGGSLIWCKRGDTWSIVVSLPGMPVLGVPGETVRLDESAPHMRAAALHALPRLVDAVADAAERLLVEMTRALEVCAVSHTEGERE